MKLKDIIDVLICPVSGEKLEIHDLTASSEHSLLKSNLQAIPRINSDAIPIGLTDRVLRTVSGSHAYPVIEEFPVLMAPEKLVNGEALSMHDPVDLHDPKYAEAYQEMEFYNSVANEELKAERIFNVMGSLANFKDISSISSSFPNPADIWIDARHDSLSQLDAYRHLAPLNNNTFLQIGGSGSHAVKALLAGARSALLMTPMIEEARFATKLAEHFCVAERLACVIGVGEELPFADNSIERVYSGGCFHHMQLENVACELHRILTVGGKFSGVDPWKTVLHTIGTKVIGKRETSVFCKPITSERLAPLLVQFPDMTVSQHGPILRYLFLAAEKMNIKFTAKTMMKIMEIDDTVGQFFRVQKKFGGSLVVAGTK